MGIVSSTGQSLECLFYPLAIEERLEVSVDSGGARETGASNELRRLIRQPEADCSTGKIRERNRKRRKNERRKTDEKMGIKGRRTAKKIVTNKNKNSRDKIKTLSYIRVAGKEGYMK